MTGAVLGYTCFASADDALDAYYSGTAASLQTGSTSYLTEFVKDSGSWHMKKWSIDGTGTYTLAYDVAALIPSFPTCDPAQNFLDGVEVGWGIATVIVIVACIKLMERSK